MPGTEATAILQTDFSTEFVDLMKSRIITGFEEWGSIKRYIETRDVSIDYVVDRVEEHLRAFVSTNRESHLADAANNIMFLFMRNRLRPESIRKP